MLRSNRNCLTLFAIAAMYNSIAACAESEQVSPVETTAMRSESKPDSGKSANVDEQLLAAKEDLARRLGDDAGEITVETVRHVNWRSGAIGCPAPEMAYTMAIVPGVQILLRADGEVYRYHARRDRLPFYCPADRAEAPAYGQGEEAM